MYQNRTLKSVLDKETSEYDAIIESLRKSILTKLPCSSNQLRNQWLSYASLYDDSGLIWIGITLHHSRSEVGPCIINITQIPRITPPCRWHNFLIHRINLHATDHPLLFLTHPMLSQTISNPLIHHLLTSVLPTISNSSILWPASNKHMHLVVTRTPLDPHNPTETHSSPQPLNGWIFPSLQWTLQSIHYVLLQGSL